MHSQLNDWFTANQRLLPWRGADPWAVMVSEFMLQQTPVNRVLPVWQEWLERWPTPAALAADPAAEAIRAWGRLGYPRRALRLHDSARIITAEHGGRVPDDYASLRALPGVGDYTAAAILSFAFGQRHVVLDTNVRRVFARAVLGQENCQNSPSAAERELAAELLPAQDAHVWAAATMELGAVICTARNPACERCPISEVCRWFSLGRPANGSRRLSQAYEGTDRQVRGLILGALRDNLDAGGDGVLSRSELVGMCPDAGQATRALDSLLQDSLVHSAPSKDGGPVCIRLGPAPPGR